MLSWSFIFVVLAWCSVICFLCLLLFYIRLNHRCLPGYSARWLVLGWGQGQGASMDWACRTMYGISGSKPGGFGRRSRTRSQAETRQLLEHEAARAGNRICCGYFLTVGLFEPDQAAFQHGPGRISSPNNSLVPQLATLTSSLKLEKRSALLHGNTLLQFHCPFALSWPSNQQLELIQLFEVPQSICVNCSYIWGGLLLLVHMKEQNWFVQIPLVMSSKGPSSPGAQICLHIILVQQVTSRCIIPDIWLCALLPIDKCEMIWNVSACGESWENWGKRSGSVWMEDARMYLAVTGSHV